MSIRPIILTDQKYGRLPFRHTCLVQFVISLLSMGRANVYMFWTARMKAPHWKKTLWIIGGDRGPSLMGRPTLLSHWPDFLAPYDPMTNGLYGLIRCLKYLRIISVNRGYAILINKFQPCLFISTGVFGPSTVDTFLVSMWVVPHINMKSWRHIVDVPLQLLHHTSNFS